MSGLPYLATYRAMIGDDADSVPRARADLDAAFEAARQRRFPDEPELRFVANLKKPRRKRRGPDPIDPAMSYDGLITRRREVPTREGDLHDHCNFLVWLAFPRTKRSIHERQFRAKQEWIPEGARTLPGARTREQDALTLFDEGGALLVRLAEEAEEAEPRLIAFGHALIEHFVRGRGEIAATCMHVTVDEGNPDAIDRAVARRVRDPGSFRAPGLDSMLVLDASGGYRVVEKRANREVSL